MALAPFVYNYALIQVQLRYHPICTQICNSFGKGDSIGKAHYSCFIIFITRPVGYNGHFSMLLETVKRLLVSGFTEYFMFIQCNILLVNKHVNCIAH